MHFATAFALNNYSLYQLSFFSLLLFENCKSDLLTAPCILCVHECMSVSIFEMVDQFSQNMVSTSCLSVITCVQSIQPVACVQHDAADTVLFPVETVDVRKCISTLFVENPL